MTAYLGAMKRFAFVQFCLLFASFSFSQEEKFVLRLDGYPLPQKTALPFGCLQIIDARFDQVNIGCVAKDLSFKGITEKKMLAVFPENAKTYLPKIIDGLVAFDKEKTDTLVMLLKQFRIADHISNANGKYHEPETVLTLSCSFYKMQAKRLTKLFSVDDSRAEKWPIDERPDGKEMAQQRAGAVLRLLFTVFADRTWSPGAASFSLSEAEEGIRKRLAVPVLTDTVLVPGLYKNFEEFKNNSPSIRELRIGRQNGIIKEVQDLNANILDPKTFWGLCDGEYRYVCFQQGIHRLYPVDNGFRFVFYRRDGEAGFKSNPDDILQGTGRHANPILPVQLNKTFSKYTRDEFSYLNMETGKVHTEEMIGTSLPVKFNSKSN